MYRRQGMSSTLLALSVFKGDRKRKKKKGMIPTEKKPLRVKYGSHYLPKTRMDNIIPLGQDAHFICEDEKVIGVADGVGSYDKYGIDSGVFARELMSLSAEEVRVIPNGSIDPAVVLSKAFSKTRAMGASTACIIALKDQCIHATILGDSGFVVFRGGAIIYHSPVQQHKFNQPYQLGRRSNDKPGSAEVVKLGVEPGDIIVAGTDGVFDNMFDDEMEWFLNLEADSINAPDIAFYISELCQEFSLDRNRSSPFSDSCRALGMVFNGGKPDDITVVVMCISAAVDE